MDAPSDFSLTGEPGRRRIVTGETNEPPSSHPAAADLPPSLPSSRRLLRSQRSGLGSDPLALQLPPEPIGSDPVISPLKQLGSPPPLPDIDVSAVQQKLDVLQRALDAQRLETESLRRQFEQLQQQTPPAAPSPALQLGEGYDIELDLHPSKPEGLKFELDDLLRVVIKHQASDLHLKVDSPPTVRLHGELIPIGDKPLTREECHYLVLQAVPESKRVRFLHIREVDHAHVSQGVRFRLNAFLERGHLSAAFRMVRANIPSFDQLGLPAVMTRFASLHNGLVLVTGPAGCGKSTTLAALVDWINKNRKVHIVTVEDPIEYYHLDENSFITQREIGTDTTSFVEALRQALRQDPNVILVGEMRDVETIMTAVTAAETGHLVLSTLHTPNAVQAIDRILDAFSGDQQKQIRMLLSSCLRGVVSQKLLARAEGGGRIPAVEVLVCTSTIASLINEGNTKEIYTFLQQGAHEGMQTFTDALRRLLERGIVTREEAMFHAEQMTEFRLATRHVNAPQGQNPSGFMNRL